jgi:hypothetical protein
MNLESEGAGVVRELDRIKANLHHFEDGLASGAYLAVLAPLLAHVLRHAAPTFSS